MSAELLGRLARALWAGLAAAWLLLAPVPGLAVEESATTRAEITHLMKYLRTCGCEFNRNGSWHPATAAHDHILNKLNYIRGRGTIPNAEFFIEEAATRSSMSGEAYQIRCPGKPVLESRQWLLDELKRLRQSSGKPP